MTKLFSMKSLAFAGAAAFALTLAAAPQADAAEATKITGLSVDAYGYVTIETDGDLPNTDDGNIIYYQTAKSKDKIKEGKYTAIADHDYGSYNFDKFVGKETYISFSLDGKKETTGAALKAAPKLKVKYTAKDGYTFAINGSSYAKITTDAAIDKGKTEFVAGGDGKKYTVFTVGEGGAEPEWYLNFGGTVYWQAIELNSTDGTPVYSKQAKVKIPAQPKAPKASLKLDATKAFTWKINAKQEIMLEVGGKKSEWVKGSGGADSWATIIGKTKTDKFDQTAIVSGDAITADINISLRTAADKKAASAINLIKLTKSAASPTESAVEVKTTKATFDSKGKAKPATAASITAKADIQYSVDNGTKWKKLANGKTAKLKTGTDTTVLIRIPGVSKNGLVLPSLNTKAEIDYNTGVATLSRVDYKDDKDTTAQKVNVTTVKPV